MTAIPRNLPFQVNTYTTFSQVQPAIAMDPDGNFVVTWSSSGQDGSGYGIYAQRYQDDGESDASPVGGEFQVNTHTTSNQSRSAIAMGQDGNFVVLWQSFGQDGSDLGIYGQRYASTGATLGSEFRLNIHTTDGQSRPAIAMAPSGSFVSTWSSFGQDGSAEGVFARRYNSSGVAIGNEFQVNIHTTSGQANSAIAMDQDGNFVITWHSFAQDGDSFGIFARRFNDNGNPIGGEFQVNTYTTSSQRQPAIAMSPDGDFVITWQSYGQDGDGSGIFAQRYSATGTPLGEEFQVNTTTVGNQQNPAIAMDRDGDFTIAWGTYYYDLENRGIFAQRYFYDGTPAGDEIQVTDADFIPPFAFDEGPAIAKAQNGDFSIAYSAINNSSAEVFVRQYTLERRIRGTGQNDELLGTAGDDVIRGRGGDDILYGRSGNDRILGGRGDDTLFGGPGRDVLRGGGGNDRIFGEGGRDRLFGGGGNDFLDGGGGDDFLNGGRGRNILIGGRGNDTFALHVRGLAIIRDFENGNNRIGLPSGVRFRQLEFSQRGNHAAIELDGDLIGQVNQFDADFLNRQDFVSV
jgi:Ca2+-binding RTX toxin-like protein